MKKFLVISAVLIAISSAISAKMIKETIYTGKLDQEKILSSLIVSKFYEAKISRDNESSFQYDLRSGLKLETFQAGIYKATAFNLLPTISSKLAMSLRTKFSQLGEFKIDGEKISFEGELVIDDTKIGNVKYEFNLYDLPIRRIYNPKVSRTLENTKDGFIIVENREI
jgi:hypothetical protein